MIAAVKVAVAMNDKGLFLTWDIPLSWRLSLQLPLLDFIVFVWLLLHKLVVFFAAAFFVNEDTSSISYGNALH